MPSANELTKSAGYDWPSRSKDVKAGSFSTARSKHSFQYINASIVVDGVNLRAIPTFDGLLLSFGELVEMEEAPTLSDP